jgi:hypothetical protein
MPAAGAHCNITDICLARANRRLQPNACRVIDRK